MTTFLLVIAFGLAIAVAYLNDKLGSLRSQIDELRQTSLDRMRQLHRRIEMLEKASAERRMEPAPIPESTPAPVAESIPEPLTQPPAPVFETAPPVFQPLEIPLRPPQPAAEPARSISLEERLGGNWLAKLGISILVIGVAFFLAPRLLNMGPAGKSLTGISISLLLLLGGLWLERRPPYRVFARAGISGGWALLFFTTFAMHHFDATRVIESLPLDLVLMLLVATGMVLHSLRYRSQTVTGLAFLLAFATVATSHFESASGTVVFSLVASAVLALGLVVVTTLRHWARLELAGLIAVLANHFLWLSLLLPALGGKAGFPLYWQSTALILFYWALFRAAYLLRAPLNEEEDRISSLSAVVLSGGVLGLLKLQSAHPEWAFRALLAMGTIEMLLGIWIGFWSRNRRRSAFAVLTTIATVLLVAAVPFHFHGVSWPILWLVEAHILALCGLRLGEPIFRRLGLLAGFGASLVLLAKLFLLANFRLEHPDPGRHPSLTIGLALAAALFWLHGEVYPRRFASALSSVGEAERIALAATSWLGLGAASAALWVVLPTQWIALAWLSLGSLVFALGWHGNGVLLRWQAYLAGACAFCAFFVPWIFDGAWIPQGEHGWFHVPGSEALTLLAIAGAFYALQERLGHSANIVGPTERWIGFFAGALGTLALAVRLPSLVATWGPSESASTAWAVFAVLLLAAAWFAKRAPFQIHGIALALWTGLYSIAICASTQTGQRPWWQDNLFRMSLASAILLTGLVFAFPLRKLAAAEHWSGNWPRSVQRPEQWFFFVPFALMIVTLAAELRPGNLTLGWSLLGLGAFIFALPLGERSFRLSGLALLLLCVAKVLLMDVWTFNSTDRYITLIATGAALTVVSFLYTRLREFLRKYL